jgi:hypothetical protein
MAGRRFQSLFCTGIANNFSCRIRLINKNQESEIWSAWQKLRIICPPMLEQHIMFPNLFILLLFHSFPHHWNQVCASVLLELLGRHHTGHKFWNEYYETRILAKQYLFSCPILELKLIGLESVHVVLVDVKNLAGRNEGSKQSCFNLLLS